jgi:hypothetical protein
MSLELNETIYAMDPAEALRSESGVYELTSPSGQKFQAVCRPYHSISSFKQLPELRGLNHAWRIRKVAEIRSESETATAA